MSPLLFSPTKCSCITNYLSSDRLSPQVRCSFGKLRNISFCQSIGRQHLRQLLHHGGGCMRQASSNLVPVFKVWPPSLSCCHLIPGGIHLPTGFVSVQRPWNVNYCTFHHWIPFNWLRLDQCLPHHVWTFSNCLEEHGPRNRIYSCSSWWNLSSVHCNNESVTRSKLNVSGGDLRSGGNSCRDIDVLDSRDAFLSHAPNHRGDWSSWRWLWDTLLREKDRIWKSEIKKSNLALNGCTTEWLRLKGRRKCSGCGICTWLSFSLLLTSSFAIFSRQIQLIYRDRQIV